MDGSYVLVNGSDVFFPLPPSLSPPKSFSKGSDGLMDLTSLLSLRACDCQARVLHNKDSVFPVPVGDSNNAFEPLDNACKTFCI